MNKVIIIGATSMIAQATARYLASDGDSLFLVGRNEAKLDSIADDLKVRGSPNVTTHVMDVNAFDCHESLFKTASEALDGIDVVLIAHGTLPDQKACESSFATTRAEFDTNALSTISLLTHAANFLQKQGRGVLAVISSVAGDRGRQSNYVYGATKGAVTTFAAGLRNRLHAHGVRVVTIKPGFVDTPMTAHFDKGLLWAKPDGVGKAIYRLIKNGGDVAYIPWFWRLIMFVIRAIPESLFKRMRL